MIRKIWDIALNVLIVSVAVLLIAVLTGHLCGFRYYIVLSGSMEPAIHTGSLGIVNSRAKFETIEPGNIIAYENTMGTRVTHRVESVCEDGIITKGDANTMNDGVSVNKENFIGETIGSIPFIGYILLFLQSKKGMILSVAAILVLWLLDCIIRCMTRDCKEKKHRNLWRQRMGKNET